MRGASYIRISLLSRRHDLVIPRQNSTTKKSQVTRPPGYCTESSLREIKGRVGPAPRLERVAANVQRRKSNTTCVEVLESTLTELGYPGGCSVGS